MKRVLLIAVCVFALTPFAAFAQTGLHLKVFGTTNLGIDGFDYYLRGVGGAARIHRIRRSGARVRAVGARSRAKGRTRAAVRGRVVFPLYALPITGRVVDASPVGVKIEQGSVASLQGSAYPIELYSRAPVRYTSVKGEQRGSERAVDTR